MTIREKIGRRLTCELSVAVTLGHVEGGYDGAGSGIGEVVVVVVVVAVSCCRQNLDYFRVKFRLFNFLANNFNPKYLFSTTL